MSRLQYSRLCSLIHASLHSFTSTAKSISKEEEKLLLINLSQVLIKIKFWISEFDSDSDNGDHENPFKCHSSASECLLKITNHLVFLLSLDSRYAQHLVGNVLVSISDFVIASGSYWEEFVRLLFFHSELIICKILSPSSDPPTQTKPLDLDLRLVLENAGWHSVGAIVLVLRSILKQLKDNDDDAILEVYMKGLGSCLQVLPWDSCNGVSVDGIEFCGYLVQLFCSVASQSSSLETVAIREIFNVFPKVLSWCFCKQGESRNYTLVSRYIRYKILVLMIRLNSIVNLDCEKILSWLHLIKKYFKDLLFESITHLGSDQDDCLKDSPFNETSYQHLHRRVVFLYLMCAFSLIGLKEKRKKQQCLCGNVNSCSKMGFTALYEWLERQIPENISGKSELYDYDSCKRFTKSFLQLYMHEDDMLFEVLLQLTSTPFGYPQQINVDWTSEVVKKDTLFLLSDIFDPSHIFHLFLSEIHYDHEVLLDYLISKDSGASCAEYLLRCLHIICDKWNSFTEFSFHAEVGDQSFHKRKKVTIDSCIHQELSSMSSKTDDKNVKCCKQPFGDARDCLLLLKKSVESLHQKNLFPYNPQVLLRRLTRFQELC